MSGSARHLAWPLAFIVSQVAAYAAGVRESVEQYRSGESTVTIETFAPTIRGKFPAILLLHGSGGLEYATGDVFRQIARGLAARRYVALIPHFFERTDHVIGRRIEGKDLEAWNQAVHDAIEFAIANGPVDPDRIGMIGYSLGAYLSFFQSAREPRIKAIASFSGSLPIGSKSKFPPILILHGSKDEGTPVSIVRKFEEDLDAKEIPHETHIYKGMAHNFDVDRLLDAGRRSAAFFDKHLKKSAEPKKSTPGQGRRGPEPGSGKKAKPG